ncbi:MAG TPA: CBS domain-containing protein [Burkholderiaceae bacterium]|nr:CBS domain-containing protein [Burkholderiaceae bacterium]
MYSSTIDSLQHASFPILIPGAPATRPHRMDPEAPARFAMTDFRSSPMMTVEFDASIDAALKTMRLSGIPYAFVLGLDGRLDGLVSADDIQGEKPMQYMVSVGCTETTCAWRDVTVENIMEPVDRWQVIDFVHVTRMSAAVVAALMSRAHRRYMVVVEQAADPRSRQVRGIFAAARLQALLGEDHDRGHAASSVPRRLS